MKEQPAKPMSRRRKAVIAAITLAALFVLALCALPFAVMPMFLGQRFEQEQHDPADFGIEALRVTLKTDDALNLAAWRTFAVGDAKGTVIVLSGIQNPSVTAFFGYAKLFADNGWDSLLIEMRARSQSEGGETGLGMTEWRDVKAGVDFLAADPAASARPIVAMGTSLGGATVITAAGEIPRIDGVIAVSAFASISEVSAHFMGAAGIPAFIAASDVPFLNAYLGFHFGFDALRYTPMNGLAKLAERPILLMHSTGDTQVPYSQFEKLAAQAEKHGIDATLFVRDGDHHFVCYDQHFAAPANDPDFSRALLNFLGGVEIGNVRGAAPKTPPKGLNALWTPCIRL